MTATVGDRLGDPEAARVVSAGRLDDLAAALPPGSDDVVRTAREAFTAGLSDILLIAGLAGFASGVAALLLIRADDMRDHGSTRPEADAVSESA